MPTSDQHRRQAAENEAVSLELETAHPGWAVTALFYAALHYVEAYFYIEGVRTGLPQHSASHAQRTPAVRLRLAPVFPHYHRLLDRSVAARYDCKTFTQSDVQRLRHQDLDVLRSHILPYL